MTFGLLGSATCDIPLEILADVEKYIVLHDPEQQKKVISAVKSLCNETWTALLQCCHDVDWKGYCKGKFQSIIAKTKSIFDHGKKIEPRLLHISEHVDEKCLHCQEGLDIAYNYLNIPIDQQPSLKSLPIEQQVNYVKKEINQLCLAYEKAMLFVSIAFIAVNVTAICYALSEFKSSDATQFEQSLVAILEARRNAIRVANTANTEALREVRRNEANRRCGADLNRLKDKIETKKKSLQSQGRINVALGVATFAGAYFFAPVGMARWLLGGSGILTAGSGVILLKKAHEYNRLLELIDEVRQWINDHPNSDVTYVIQSKMLTMDGNVRNLKGFSREFLVLICVVFIGVAISCVTAFGGNTYFYN
jgi:hypothetical protein